MGIARIFSTTLVISACLIPAGYAQTDERNAHMSEDQQQVLDAVLSMTAAFHNRDINGIMASYERDAVVVFEPGEPTNDPDAVRAGFEGFFGLSPSFSYKGHEVLVSGDTAIHIAPWSMTATGPDGAEIDGGGLSVAVLRRQPDGKWLMVIDNPYGSYLEEQ